MSRWNDIWDYKKRRLEGDWWRYSGFPPDRAIVGIPHCIQRRPPEKLRKGQFSPLLLQGCMQASPRHSILVAISRFKIATDVVANEPTIYTATDISFLATKNFQMADRVWNCPIMHFKPLVIDYVMYAFELFFWHGRGLHASIWWPDICIWGLFFTNYCLLAPFLKNWRLKKIFRGHFGPQVKFSGWNTGYCLPKF